MKVSVVVTTLNEAETIGLLIKSLLAQTKKTDEIIIVDAGSTDGTIRAIQKTPKVKLVIKPGANRSRARNAGIKQAKNPIIAVTDAGCVADKHWLERLTKPFSSRQVVSVAGYYRAVAKTWWQKSLVPFVAIMPDRFDKTTYLPSSRSLAFRKGAARYPEKLNYCEDLIFAERLKAAGKMAVVPGALVYWRQVKSWWGFFLQIYNYARGDAMAHYQPHLKRIYLVFLRYLIFFLIKPLFSLYLFWPIIKHQRYVKNWRGWILLPAAQITADFGVMAGSLSAIISRE